MHGAAPARETSDRLANRPESSASGRDEGFDRRVLGQIVVHALIEADRLGEPVADRLGVQDEGLIALVRYLRLESFVGGSTQRRAEPEDEELMVRALLKQNCASPADIGDWVACIVARRALEPNHLWEDLGLATRPDLSGLLLRHFPDLAAKNTRNMRWKKFLYRSLCEAEGFSMCPSPTCDSCAEFDICYGDDSGESVMARNSRKSRAI
jgi:nitrogen fixation protein NifQ